MAYYIDSNVIIGYIFYNADGWSRYARAVMNSMGMKHSGQTVKNECFGSSNNGKCNTIKRQISNEIRRVIAALNRGLTLESILNQMKENDCRTDLIIRDVAEVHRESLPLLASRLRESQRAFEANYNYMEREIYSIVEFHDRNCPYVELYNLLNIEIEDKDDVEVIIDAHHIGLKIKDLIFVSGDYHHIFKHKELICVNTSIRDVKYLKSFTPSHLNVH